MVGEEVLQTGASPAPYTHNFGLCIAFLLREPCRFHTSTKKQNPQRHPCGF